MKLLEWNINKRTQNIPVKPFVYNEVAEQNADIICLVEYINDKGIKNKLDEEYWIEESVPRSGNQILIAVSKLIAPNGIKIIRNTEEKGCYNFLHINFTNNKNKKLSVIGIRMLSPMDAPSQVKPLNAYLSALTNSFICTGDFNIKDSRISHWFPDFKIGKLITATQEIDNSSIVYADNTINGFGAVDHVIGSKDLKISSKYNWDFIKDDNIYPLKNNIELGQIWNIKPPYPDHAMLISDIKF